MKADEQNDRKTLTIVLLGEPVPAAQKHARANGWKFLPTRQRDAMTQLRHAASVEMLSAGLEPFAGPLRLTVRAELPIPESKPKRWKAAALCGAEWPIVRPDLKNIVWLAEDALESVVYADDKQVCQHVTEKVYSGQPKLVIEVTQIKRGK